MTQHLDCNSLSINAMEDSLAICLGNLQEDSLAEYVMLQAPLKEDGDSNSDEIYFEINDQGSSHYGGILKCIITSDTLEVQLGESAAKELGLEPHPANLEIKLSLNKDEVEELTYALSEVIFKNSDTFSIQ